MPGLLQQIPGVAPSPVMTSDEIMGHVDSVYQSLPDPVKQALDHAHSVTGGDPSFSVADAVKTEPTNSSVAPPPIEVSGMGMAGSPGVAPPPVDKMTTAPQLSTGPMQAEYNRVTAPPLSGALAHTKADTGQSGIGQIHNPWARVPLQIGEGLLNAFIPGGRAFTSFVPGFQSHHQAVVDDAMGAATQEQETAKNAADVAHTQAQTGLVTAQAAGQPAETALHNAQAANYLSESDARKNPSLKPLAEPVIDPNDTTKTPRIGYHDEHDPTGKVIYGPAVGAKPVAAHQPTNEIEAFLHAPENQGRPVADVLKDFWTNKAKATGEGKLLTPETAGTLNSVWNSLAPKYHLTSDPFRQGMSDSETKHVQDSMNAAIAREQGGQHITIQQQNADTAGKKAQSKEVADAVKPIVTDMNKQFGLAHDQAETAKDAIDALKGGAIGQALATIKSIVAVAGGKGSGVRITQAEINSIANATGWAGNFENFINSAKGEGKLNATQQKQLTDILNGIRQKAAEKAQVLDSTINRLESAESKEEVHKIHSEYRNQVMGGNGSPVQLDKSDPSKAAEQFNALPKGADFLTPDGKAGKKQ